MNKIETFTNTLTVLAVLGLIALCVGIYVAVTGFECEQDSALSQQAEQVIDDTVYLLTK